MVTAKTKFSGPEKPPKSPGHVVAAIVVVVVALLVPRPANPLQCFTKKLENSGLIFSGINKELNVVETIELKNHPWFVASQFHPELKSRVNRAHPLFREFVKASVKELK